MIRYQIKMESIGACLLIMDNLIHQDKLLHNKLNQIYV